jgi:hypothetical protein
MGKAYVYNTKKDGRVRWISDLRALNKALKRRVYPLPMIQDVIQRRAGYKCFTKLDLTMFYYALELDEESKDLCTIVTPFGKFQYYRMAMGLKTAPDVAQAVIEGILTGLDVETYIDDIGIFSNDYDEHMRKISAVLIHLEDNGCIKPWKKKVLMPFLK